MSDKPCKATPREELERQIMPSIEPKNEREWWARDEIERLRAELAPALERMSKLDFERTVVELERDALRAELAAERERAGKYQRIAAELTDRLNGTPCAEIRWQQERAELRVALIKARPYVTWALPGPYNGSKQALAAIDAVLAETGGGDE